MTNNCSICLATWPASSEPLPPKAEKEVLGATSHTRLMNFARNCSCSGSLLAVSCPPEDFERRNGADGRLRDDSDRAYEGGMEDRLNGAITCILTAVSSPKSSKNSNSCQFCELASKF